jgi:hypothetical protein
VDNEYLFQLLLGNLKKHYAWTRDKGGIHSALITWLLHMLDITTLDTVEKRLLGLDRMVRWRERSGDHIAAFVFRMGIDDLRVAVQLAEKRAA